MRQRPSVSESAARPTSQIRNCGLSTELKTSAARIGASAARASAATVGAGALASDQAAAAADAAMATRKATEVAARSGAAAGPVISTHFSSQVHSAWARPRWWVSHRSEPPSDSACRPRAEWKVITRHQGSPAAAATSSGAAPAAKPSAEARSLRARQAGASSTGSSTAGYSLRPTPTASHAAARPCRPARVASTASTQASAGARSKRLRYTYSSSTAVSVSSANGATASQPRSCARPSRSSSHPSPRCSASISVAKA